MLIGLGTGSCGTAELARQLDLPHEIHWLPWEIDLDRLNRSLPEIQKQKGEVGLYFLPYVEAILEADPKTQFICMQRDVGRTVRGLVRKLVRNPFAVPEDAKAFHHGFPFYGGVTLQEGVHRFYRDYYSMAYRYQQRFPDRFRIFFTDHLLGSDVPASNEVDQVRFADLCKSVQEDFGAFCGGLS